MPAAIQIVTIFCAGPCVGSVQPAAVRALLDFMTSPDTAEAMRRCGMEPA